MFPAGPIETDVPTRGRSQPSLTSMINCLPEAPVQDSLTSPATLQQSVQVGGRQEPGGQRRKPRGKPVELCDHRAHDARA